MASASTGPFVPRRGVWRSHGEETIDRRASRTREQPRAHWGRAPGKQRAAGASERAHACVAEAGGVRVLSCARHSDEGDQTRVAVTNEAGGREGGQPTRGPVARRSATPHRTPAQRRVRQPTRPAGSLANRARTTQQERAQPERSSGRTWQWGALSHVQRGAPRCINAPSSAATRARLSLARCPPPRAQPATPDTTREPSPPVPVPACVAACARAHAQCGVRDGEARRLCPPSWCVHESCAYGAPRRRKRGTQQPTLHQPACVHAGLLLTHKRTPEETKPDSRDVARLARAAPPRVIQRTHLEGREGRAPPLHYHKELT